MNIILFLKSSQLIIVRVLYISFRMTYNMHAITKYCKRVCCRNNDSYVAIHLFKADYMYISQGSVAAM